MSTSPLPTTVRISVVIPTYARAERIARLIEQLAAQTLSPAAFEVVVVDDGSPEDPRPRLAALKTPFRLVVERQANQGPAAARHRGVALARGEVVLFLDDDMIPSPRLLEEHLRVHDATPRAVVNGCIRASDRVHELSLFERFHARILDRYTTSLRTTGRNPRGPEVCTGNVSLRRADYLAVGGFDRDLGRSEDAELGLKLEEAGAALRFSDAAYTIHDSDHGNREGWLKRARDYGLYETRIAHRHPDALHASPWHWLDIMSPILQPAYALSIVAPAAGRVTARGLMALAEALDHRGFERPALAATTLAYGVEYYRGVRAESGSARACLRDLRRFRDKQRAVRNGSRKVSARRAKRAAFDRFVASVRADHATMQRYDGKYDTRGRKPSTLAHDLVERIGFQMLTGFRLMRLARDLGAPLAAKITARLIRFLYGADVHWDAEIADGVSLNHGMGLAISHAARIGKGTILSHNVSIGDGIDPLTRAVGAPTIEEDVHIGPGAILLGPITIGARTKIMPGALVLTSVPPDSLVETPPPRVVSRTRRPANPPAQTALGAR